MYLLSVDRAGQEAGGNARGEFGVVPKVTDSCPREPIVGRPSEPRGTNAKSSEAAYQLSIGEQPAWDLLARAVRSREFQGISGLGDLAARGDCVLRRTDSLFRISNSGDFSISGVVEGDSAAVRVCFRFRCRKPGIVATSLVALGMTTLGLLTACDPFFALDDHRAVAREREAIRSAWMGALHKALLPHVGARAQPYR